MSAAVAPTVRPPDTAELAAVLREVDAGAGTGPVLTPRVTGAPPEHRTVVVRGAGTKATWGGALSTVDVVLDTTRLSGVVGHEPGDRVVTVRAGTPLRDLQAVLGLAGQRLAVESGFADATVGGVLATGEAGPLRLRYGTGRDLLIGVQFVRADGVVARSGGKVVKNVAGYDVGRLLCGSYGTIGVITEASFRLHPLPAASVWVVAEFRKDALLPPTAPAGILADLVGAVQAPAVAPSAVELNLTGDTAQIAVLVEGSRSGVVARGAALRAILSGAASVTAPAVTDEPVPWWGVYPFADGEIGLKLAVPVGVLSTAIGVLRANLGPAVTVRGSAGTGVVHAGAPPSVPVADLAAALRGVRALLPQTGGSCVVVTAPPSIRDRPGDGLDLWGPVAGLPIMRRLKTQFDPAGRFAPGRFVGGL